MDPTALAEQGRRHLAAGELAEAERRFRELLAQDGSHPAGLGGLARVALAVGRTDVALSILRPAAQTHPGDEDLQRALLDALARHAAERPMDAAVRVDQALALDRAGDAVGARDAFFAALMADPGNRTARWMGGRVLPRVYGSGEEIALWRRRFADAVIALTGTVDPRSPDAAEEAVQGLLLTSNFALPYQAQDDRPLQEAWGRMASRLMAARFPDLAERPAPRPRTDGRPLRVGYVSSFFFSHTITLLFNGWIQFADRSKVEPYVYVVGGQRDTSTDTLLRMAAKGHDLRHDSLETAARTIRDDACDVLVYPDLGMDPRSFALAALPLAPQQCVSWGHPVTTGLPTMDWFLTSDAMEPDGGERYYSEKLVRLPRLSIAYSPSPPLVEPPSRAQLGLPEQGTLYLCCQAQQKYLPMHDAVFPAIARQVPDARFVFIRHRSMHDVNRRFRERIETAFRAQGLDPANHLVFLPWLEWRTFLALNAVCDVFLDSIGWSGGNTTLEALSQGLPPVTLPTAFMRGRHTYAMLRLMEMPELIAADLREYVGIAARLGTDPAWRRDVRARVAERRDRLYRDVGAVRALEEFFEKACAGETEEVPPAAGE